MNALRFLPALLFLAAGTANLPANGGGYIQGVKSTGPFRPVNVDRVEMVSEKLDIELQSASAVVSIVYRFHNPGDAVDVEMGFPCSVAVRGPPDADRHVISAGNAARLQEFSLRADGVPVESEFMKDHASLPGGESEPQAHDLFRSRLLDSMFKDKVGGSGAMDIVKNAHDAASFTGTCDHAITHAAGIVHPNLTPSQVSILKNKCCEST